MADDPLRLARRAEQAGLLPALEMLRETARELGRDRRKLGALTSKTAGRVAKAVRKKLSKELDRGLARLRETDAKARRARAAKASRGIRGARLAPPRTAPIPRRTRGRSLAALRARIDALAAAETRRSRQAVDAIRHNGRAIEAIALRQVQLERSQEELARIIAELQERGLLALFLWLLDLLLQLEGKLKKLRKARAAGDRELGEQLEEEVESIRGELRELQRRARRQTLIDAATMMQVAAFGAPDGLLHQDNLVIAGNHLVLSFIEDLLGPLGVDADGAAVVGTLAPLVGLVVASLLLGDEDDALAVTSDAEAPTAPALQLAFATIKQFVFDWTPSDGVYYQLLERAAPGEAYVRVGPDIIGDTFDVADTLPLTVPLHLRHQASYVLRTCNFDAVCVGSAPVDVVGSLATAVGYFKASNTDGGDLFGTSVALGSDGDTLAVSAMFEQSSANTINGDETDDSITQAGAVYVFTRDAAGAWLQQVYVKPSNMDDGDRFGFSLALSADGDTLVVGATGEASNANVIGGDETDDSIPSAGAVYVFVRDGLGAWSQQAYIKPFNPDGGDQFGGATALSADGNTLAVGARFESSNETGIGGTGLDDTLGSSGAVYVFVRDAMGLWSQQEYIKASNADAGDQFGFSLGLSASGDTLVVGATGEASSTGADEDDDAIPGAGAVYVFERDAASQWSQQAYLKASNPDGGDQFGAAVSLSDDGMTLAVAARFEDSDATGVGGSQGNAVAGDNSGAAYVFTRGASGQWSQEAYIKASNTGSGDRFGQSLSLSGNGRVLAVGADSEDSSATGIGGAEGDDPGITNAGAVYVFVRDASGQWSQRSYVKASNTDSSDQFGASVSLSATGETLAVGATTEGSAATGIGGNQADDTAGGAGAVYLY